ncbi:MAG: DNA primase [Bacteroidales bacterium]|jgi:DNA primase|nr:DNA primase [Bacteroidales bacterium]
MYISQQTVNQIFEVAKIEEVVSDFVTLRRSGVIFKGLCPFHNEKTPSFTVSPSLNIYKCFGCSEGGNSVNFLMKLKKFTYPEALTYLANKYHIPVIEEELTDEQKIKASQTESLLIVNQFAAEYFNKNLQNTEEGKLYGLSYFKERGFTDEIINEFQLGYCLAKKNDFTEAAIKAGHNLDFLKTVGLTIGNDYGNIDRFYGRVMFPIFGQSGKIQGFGGRILTNEKTVAKYLNSPDSEVYNKSKILYGLFQAKPEIRKQDKCFLVEGYTDVLSLYQSEIKNVVASSGTSLTVEQTKLIHSVTHNVTLLYDGDAAGIKASNRGMDILLEEGLDVKIVLFPDNDDPDSFVRKYGGRATLDYINNHEQDIIEFKSNFFQQETKNDISKKSEFISETARSIALIKTELKRELYAQRCSEIFNIRVSSIQEEIDKYLQEKDTENQKKLIVQQQKSVPKVENYSKVIQNSISSILYASEKEMIKTLLLFGEEIMQNDKTISNYIFSNLKNDDLTLKNPLFDKILKLVENKINNGLALDALSFTNNQDPEISEFSAEIFYEKDKLSALWKKRGHAIIPEVDLARENLKDLFKRYKICIISEQKEKLLKDLSISEEENNLEKLQQLLENIKMIDSIIKKLKE